MAKVANVLGLMSGTSMDGIDMALLRTDGENMAEALGAAFLPYPDDIKLLIRSVLGRAHDADGSVTKAEQAVTDWHVMAVGKFHETTLHEIDLIGFHGQTIFHDPARKRTWQIGDGERLARETGIDVIYDFRSNDMRAGGQGAPLLPLYHQALVRAAKLENPACVLNLGGVANITWMDGETVIACDTGPANALIDDWMLAKTGVPMDKDGAAATKGTVDVPRVLQWLQHPYFQLPAPKSLDRNAFHGCKVDDLSLEDGAATLTAFTVESVLKTVRQMPRLPKNLIVAGGGRHNAAIMNALQKCIPTIDADTLGWNGDNLEAEGFAYLAQRSVRGLPLSLPTTTGCKTPVTGGKKALAHAA
ncbi:MAG: anhydro-N-acetylmuramic acid kinase [Proteobacteria bacterium]|nr:anhydro-N-acetylmuramic acid kinase [Pseudomonadota bacterium]